MIIFPGFLEGDVFCQDIPRAFVTARGLTYIIGRTLYPFSSKGYFSQIFPRFAIENLQKKCGETVEEIGRKLHAKVAFEVVTLRIG